MVACDACCSVFSNLVHKYKSMSSSTPTSPSGVTASNAHSFRPKRNSTTNSSPPRAPRSSVTRASGSEWVSSTSGSGGAGAANKADSSTSPAAGGRGRGVDVVPAVAPAAVHSGNGSSSGSPTSGTAIGTPSPPRGTVIPSAPQRAQSMSPITSSPTRHLVSPVGMQPGDRGSPDVVDGDGRPGSRSMLKRKPLNFRRTPSTVDSQTGLLHIPSATTGSSTIAARPSVHPLLPS